MQLKWLPPTLPNLNRRRIPKNAEIFKSESKTKKARTSRRISRPSSAMEIQSQTRDSNWHLR